MTSTAKSRLTATDGIAGAPLAEHAMAALTTPVTLRDGCILPAGTRGAIVFVYAGGAAYEVEFDEPFRAVVTIEASSLREATSA